MNQSLLAPPHDKRALVSSSFSLSYTASSLLLIALCTGVALIIGVLTCSALSLISL